MRSSADCAALWMKRPSADVPQSSIVSGLVLSSSAHKKTKKFDYGQSSSSLTTLIKKNPDGCMIRLELFLFRPLRSCEGAGAVYFH